ncbi:SUMF1/EgtB/PvdO family nonheme iron enzyme [Lewinella sp. LCG006]|uniref:SUMF1/EgtB/PvdO family nonheme iron enzyme n=1 Tax=Lewinella sp. LCG006 TaxID=3231911 RepID=UPI00345F9AFF
MADLKAHIDTFPLEHLFQRLRLAGFRLSPGDRLRALRVLGGPGKTCLQEPEKLKALLAPVLVRSEAEQLKFYEIFDQYYQEVSAPLELDPSSPKENDWWRWLLILPLLAGLWYAYYALTQHKPRQEELSVYIDGPSFGAAGDTVLLKNLSRYSGDSSELSWRWSYVNLATQKEEAFSTDQFDWSLIVPSLDSGSYRREIRLAVHHPEKDTVYQATLPFTVLCPAAPAVTGITGPQQLEVGQEANFRTLFSEESLYLKGTGEEAQLTGAASNWAFTWEFGDGTQEEGTYLARHQYAQNGQYRVRLTVSDTTAKGFCVATQTLEVKVGQDQAFLPLFELREDQLSVLATWAWGFYVILALLGVGLLYYWVRWLVHRRKPLTAQQIEDARDEAFAARFAHSDKAPYFIPLRDQSAAITFSSVQLRFADALRLRQEGLRKELDMTKTLQATIDRGGFPDVRFRYATQPSEYLCLIDEQNRASHLGELFKYLARSLSAQDVNLEVYYYRKHLSQCWNAYFPKGRTLDQLQRAYPNHRLLVFGDLHELIDPHAAGQPRLRLGAAAVLRQWPLRLLFTPVPPVSWSYREKLLARVFSVFSTDTEGLSAATLYIENEGELLPDGAAYDRWQNRQQEQRRDADTEHRNWRRWRYIKEYLQAYDEDLVRWFKALAVFPLPSWEMTIAIGKALEVAVTYDNLLRLARIPTLQSERFDERLRRELMAELDETDEYLARTAVQAELSAVKTISAGSHAHRDLETALAIQDFALAPEEEGHRDTLRFLLRRNLLTPAQEADLDRIADRETGGRMLRMTKGGSSLDHSPKSIRDWLEEDTDIQLDAPTPPSADNRKDLRRALWFTAAYVILLALGWKFGASDALYRLAFAETPEQRAERPAEPLRNYILVKETAVIDSAIIYNNQGVRQARIGENRDTLAARYFEQALGAANSLLYGKGEEFNGKAVPYSLANANLARLYFNAAAANLNAYLQDSLGQAILPRSLALLDQAYISDSVALDVLHARGVVHYYAGSPEDSSLYYYRLLDSLDYFTNLDYTPNLETLLGRERSRIVAVDVSEIGGQALEVSVEYYYDPSVDREVEMVMEPQGDGNQPAIQPQSLSPGAGTLTFRLAPPRAQPGALKSLRVQMRRRNETTVIDKKEIAYQHDWNAPAPRQRTTTQPPTPNKVNRFELRGQLLDAATQEPIAEQALVLTEQPNRGVKIPLTFNGKTDFYGEYVLRGDLEGHLTSTFVLEVIADGYKTYRKTFQFGEELLKERPLTLAPISLEKNIPRPRMELISGGGFQMGSSEKGAYNDELPAHEVIVGNFYLGTREVTFAEYDLFCDLTAHVKPDDEGWGRNQRPVINISWLDAATYCNWLSEQHGYTPVYEINLKSGSASLRSEKGRIPNGYRLPTEAEWEYAARGGVMGDKSERYSGSNNLSEVGWYEANSKDQTHPVAQLQPNNAGIYDMSGNVWEWCFDWYGEYPSTPQRGPIGPDAGSHRIIRGGAWLQSADDCRVSTRQYRRPEEKTVYIGFRLARN